MVPDNMDALEWLRKHLEAEGSDLLREMVRTFAERLMAAEVDSLCNATYGEVTPERTNSRNGYRSRQLDTRVGSVDLSIPKQREGSYFPGWLLERSDTARTVVADYRAECQRSREIIERAGLDELSTRPTPSGLQVALRWVVLHVIEQTNRHAGHADVLRHLIDGATGPSARRCSPAVG